MEPTELILAAREVQKQLEDLMARSNDPGAFQEMESLSRQLEESVKAFESEIGSLLLPEDVLAVAGKYGNPAQFGLGTAEARKFLDRHRGRLTEEMKKEGLGTLRDLLG